MKYCKNCGKDTERYKSGHCKPCVRSRNEKFNQKRADITPKYINYEKVQETRNSFNKNEYTRLDITDIVTSSKDKYIYFLTKSDELVYIGKSNGNLLSRISTHTKDKDFDDVYVRAVNDIKSLDKYEKKWITKYRPKLNKEYIFNGITYDVFDLKSETKITATKEELIDIIGCAESTINSLLTETRKKLYKRYVLYKNRPKESNFKNILDTHTGKTERHNYITFAEKVGKSQNAVWYFMNGIQKTFLKKRYVIVE